MTFAFRSGPADAPSLAELERALFRPMGAAGVRARTGLHEEVLEALSALISRQRPEAAETLRFPPVMSRGQIEAAGYLKSFPNLLGCVCCLDGSESDIRRAVGRFVEGGELWTSALGASDLVLTPASCYPLYPIAAAKGPAPAEGWTFDVGCDCFRREPSEDLDRLQSFRMREFVRIGSGEQVEAFRQAWLDKARALADGLGLTYAMDIANDPFFGRGAPLLAASQREQSLKFELLVPVLSHARPTACMSFNYHQDHFGAALEIKLASGEPAHTGCVAFGMDRLTLALFVHHGLTPNRWPKSVRGLLGI
jgi:seryl-tRNA synthetase